MLAIYHYNIQYVAGAGKRTEDAIIKESLVPLLDFYLKHPGWGADFEMQGLMVEIVAKRFPKIFKKLKTLVNRKQIDLISFHYSDQLFLAYPLQDLLWSEKLQQAIFKKSGLRRAPSVFTQEGQFGEGMLPFMLKNGMRIAVLPKNLFKFLFGDDFLFYPYYSLRGGYVVAGEGRYRTDDLSITLHWSYLDDAELLPTGRVNPYFLSSFRYKKEALERYEQKLLELEKKGYQLVTVREYVERLKALKLDPKPLPAVIDGTWQPEDTENFFQWMGRRTIYNEKDMKTLSNNYDARADVLAAEVMVELAKQKGLKLAGLTEQLDRAYRHILLAEVSDSTGWNPFPMEITYSRKHAAKAREIARKLIHEVKKALGLKQIFIDTDQRRILTDYKPPERRQTDCPVKVFVKGEFKTQKISCFSSGSGRIDLQITFADPSGKIKGFLIRFPRKLDSLLYSPGLLDDEFVSIPLKAFPFEKITLPLANGLIGLDQKLYLIKHNRRNHLGCRILRNSPYIEFEEQSTYESPVTLYFSVVREDAGQALHHARRINVTPILKY